VPAYQASIAARDVAEATKARTGISMILGTVTIDQQTYTLACIDLDACISPLDGSVMPWAQELIDGLNTYTETSVLGEGVHALFVMPKIHADLLIENVHQKFRGLVGRWWRCFGFIRRQGRQQGESFSHPSPPPTAGGS
jgi:hypothetical protein